MRWLAPLIQICFSELSGYVCSHSTQGNLLLKLMYMAHFSGLFPLSKVQISAESSPGCFRNKRVGFPKRAKTDGEVFFKDAFPPLCFWVGLIFLVLGRPQSLPFGFGSYPSRGSVRSWFMFSLQEHGHGNIVVATLFSGSLQSLPVPVLLLCTRSQRQLLMVT